MELLKILIVSTSCLRLLRLVGITALPLVLHSNENHSQRIYFGGKHETLMYSTDDCLTATLTKDL